MYTSKEDLYRKVYNDGEFVGYVKVSDFIYHGDPKPGIYLIKEIPNGTRRSFVSERIDNCPPPMSVTKFMMKQEKVEEQIAEVIQDSKDVDGSISASQLTTRRIIDAIKRGLMSK